MHHDLHGSTLQTPKDTPAHIRNATSRSRRQQRHPQGHPPVAVGCSATLKTIPRTRVAVAPSSRPPPKRRWR
eukprot:358954-Chlamydomonas_euryale.AAC.3